MKGKKKKKEWVGSRVGANDLSTHNRMYTQLLGAVLYVYINKRKQGVDKSQEE